VVVTRDSNSEENPRVNKKFLTAIISLFVVASSVLALNGFNGNSFAAIDNTPDDDTVAIIRKGAFSESELRADAAKGDVPKVMSAFGISQSELNGFVEGVVWKNGRVTVNDKVVATGAITAGRWNNPTSDMTRIAGTDRAYKMSTSHFVDDGQTAFVKMVNGQFAFAVIKSCGNPVTAKPMPKPPVPAYACESLTISKKISRTSFRFAPKASASGGAKITNYRYDYGDGTIATTPAAGPSHTYAKPGTYTAKVTVLVTVNGKTVEVNGAKCQVMVTVENPPTTPPKEEKCPHDSSLPKDSPDCERCPYSGKEDLSVNSDECEETPPVTPPETPDVPDETPPEVLPETGPADFAIGGLGISSIAGAGYYWRSSRRNLINKLLNR